MQRRWRLIQDSGWVLSQANSYSQRDQRLKPQTLNHDCSDDMASFARAIKSPYLSPRIRPSMPGRSMSTNSDQANPPQSPRSGEIIGEFDLSGRNTPAIPPQRPSELQDGFFDLDDIEPRTSYFSGTLALGINIVRIAWNAYPISSRLTPDYPSIPTSLSMIFHHLASSE